MHFFIFDLSEGAEACHLAPSELQLSWFCVFEVGRHFSNLPCFVFSLLIRTYLHETGRNSGFFSWRFGVFRPLFSPCSGWKSKHYVVDSAVSILAQILDFPNWTDSNLSLVHDISNMAWVCSLYSGLCFSFLKTFVYFSFVLLSFSSSSLAMVLQIGVCLIFLVL